MPKNITDPLSILQVPIAINFGSGALKTGIDIDDLRLFQHVDSSGIMPATSAPSPGDFSDEFAPAFRSGTESVICFCVSSEISATYEAAISARKLMPDRDIHVFESCSVSLGQGFIVLMPAGFTPYCVKAIAGALPAPAILAKPIDIPL